MELRRGPDLRRPLPQNLPDTTEIFQYFRQRFGRSVLMGIFACSERQIYRYCQGRHEASSDRAVFNPIDNVEAMFRLLVEFDVEGDFEMAHNMVLRFSHVLGMRMVPMAGGGGRISRLWPRNAWTTIPCWQNSTTP